MTQGDIVISALVAINELAPGATPNADEMVDGTERFNALLDQWKTIGLHVLKVTNVTKALTGATGSYTIGSGGAIDTTRPVKIQSAGVILSGARHPLRLITSVEYAALVDKAASAVVPEVLFNDNDYPLAKLYLWPVQSGTPTLDLWLWAPILTPFTVRKYTDLVIDGTTNTKVTSAAYPFVAGDVGKFLNVAEGTGFTPGRYTISSVLAGVATLSASVGTVASTGGVATYDETVDLPPGYLKPIRYNLALDLAPEYGRDPSPILAIAQSSLETLRELNASNWAAMETPPAPAAPPGAAA